MSEKRLLCAILGGVALLICGCGGGSDGKDQQGALEGRWIAGTVTFTDVEQSDWWKTFRNFEIRIADSAITVYADDGVWSWGPAAANIAGNQLFVSRMPEAEAAENMLLTVELESVDGDYLVGQATLLIYDSQRGGFITARARINALPRHNGT